MRYSNEHKQQTRERLLNSSGALAKRGGFSSTGVAGLMKAIGLTGGAFYNHFPSKDDLFTEVVRQELHNSPLARLATQGASRERLAEHWLVELHQAWSATLEDDQLAWVLISQCVGALMVGRMLATERVQSQVLDASRQFVEKALHEVD